MLLRTTSPDSLHVRLHFSAPVDSASATTIPDPVFVGATPEPPAYTTVLLQLAAPMAAGTIFPVRATGLKDCMGREIPRGDYVPAGRPAHPAGIVVSEVLPDPAAGTEDFLEIYNNGAHAVELQDLRWSVRADDGGWKAPSPVVRRPYLLFPGEYLALNPSPEALCRQYACLGRMEFAALPALAAEAGRLGLFSREGQLIDEVSWDRKRHAPELLVTKGVSFERLDFGASGLAPANWHSAASTAGFATPGYPNSHRVADGAGGEWCRVEPKIFRPNNDGIADLAWISWGFPAPGFRLDIRIFDAAGRQVRHLAAGISAADKGRISWNGLGDNGLPLPAGNYALKVAAWSGNGQQLSRKLAVVLLRD